MVRKKFFKKINSILVKRCLVRDSILPSIDFPYSKGWAFRAESYGGLDNIYSATEILTSEKEFSKIYKKNSSSYWLKTGSRKFPNLDHFVNTVLPYQEVPFILFCSDGDLTFPGDANGESVSLILGHPLCRAIYAQNLDNTDYQNKKLRHIPIGLDLHTYRKDGMGGSLFEGYKKIAEKSSKFRFRKNKIFSDINLNHTNRVRNVASQLLKGNESFSFLPERISQLALWNTYAEHKYVLSLPGNGYDCHRTWEALGLGCGVVTISSPLDDMFKRYPVFIADNIAEIAEDGFNKRIECFFERCDFARKKITFSEFYENN